jgi:hypothetical protein
MGIEKRKHCRFLVQDDVIVVLRDGITKIGKAKDIGVGGLSFEHIYDEYSNRESAKRDIFLLLNGFHMSNLQCRLVYDIPVRTPKEYQDLTICLVTRVCGVQFEALSEDQLAQLDFFLKTYTKGTAP